MYQKIIELNLYKMHKINVVNMYTIDENYNYN